MPKHYEKGDYHTLAYFVNTVTGGVDCAGLQVFTIRQLAHLPRIGNCAANFGLPCSVNRVEHSEIAFCPVRRGTLGCFYPALDRMPYVDIQGFNLSINY